MNNYSARHLRLMALAVFLFAIPGVVYANGAARSTGMGIAFTAVADDASAVFSNPAGLTQITGKQIYGGLSAIDLDSEYTSPSGEKERTRSQIFYSPHFYLSSDLGTKDARLGFGMFSPFGIGGMTWSGEGLTRYVSTENMIGTLSLNPTAAYRISRVLSVGFGLDYMLSMAQAGMKVDQSFLGAQDGEMRTEAKGDGWGYNAGILFAPSPEMSFGISYRSEIRIKYKGDVTYSGIAPLLQSLFGGPEYATTMRTTLDFPSVLALGIKFRPAQRMLAALDFERTRWSSFDETLIDFGNEIPEAAFTDTVSRMDWKNVWSIKAGLEFLMTAELALRVGYNYIPTPVPEHTLDPGNPDADLQNIMLGFGYRFEKASLDVYYMKTLYEKRTVNNSILSGQFENSAQSLGLSLGYPF